MSAPRIGAVPLQYRVPNPPRRAATRVAEEEALRGLLDEGPLTLVHGPAGAGKSVLVAAVLGKHFRERVERTLVVACGQRHGARVARAVLEAWSTATAQSLDARQIEDDERVEAAVIDAIEQSGWWVVLEDTSLDGATLGFLGKIERYSRDARWVVLTRERPDDWLPGVYVEPMAGALPATSAQPRAVVVREMPLPDLRPPASTELTRVLALGDEPSLAIEALKELRRAGRIDTLVEALERGLSRWLAAGHGSAVAAALDGVVHPSVRPFRLRCALAGVDFLVLRQCDAPAEHELAQRLDWGRALQAAGEHAMASDMLASVASRAAADPASRALADGARIALARSLLELGKQGEAREALAGVNGEGQAAQALRDALLAAALPAGHPEARALVDRALERLPRLSRQERVVVGVTAARTLHDLGLPRACRACLEQAFQLAEEHPMTADIALGARLLQARSSLDVGELARCDAEVEALAALVPRHPGLRPELLAIEVERALLRGDDAAAASLLSALEAEAGDEPTSRLRLRGELHAMTGQPPPGAPAPGGGVAGRLAQLSRLRVAARHGDTTPPPPDALDEVHARLRLVRRLLEAEIAAVEGSAQATRLARQALDDARACGLAAREAESLALLAEVHLAARSAAWPALARELGELASRLGSPRHQARAALLLALPAGPRGLAEVERLGSSGGLSEASRRARALLGDETPLDRLDERILGAMRELLAPPEVLVRRPGGPRWGLHLPSMSVFREDGAWIDLSGGATHFRILDALRAQGGRATKEQLVVAVWQERSYHPTRHDNRLHTAVRKLRRLIEPEPTPRLLLTEEDGYSLGGTVRVAR